MAGVFLYPPSEIRLQEQFAKSSNLPVDTLDKMSDKGRVDSDLEDASADLDRGDNRLGPVEAGADPTREAVM